MYLSQTLWYCFSNSCLCSWLQMLIITPVFSVFMQQGTVSGCRCWSLHPYFLCLYSKALSVAAGVDYYTHIFCVYTARHCQWLEMLIITPIFSVFIQQGTVGGWRCWLLHLCSLCLYSKALSVAGDVDYYTCVFCVYTARHCQWLEMLIITPVFSVFIQQGTVSGWRCWLLHLCFLCLYSKALSVAGDVDYYTCVLCVYTARHCQWLEVLELDHLREVGEDTARAMCTEGLKTLATLEFTFTPVTPKALLVLSSKHTILVKTWTEIIVLSTCDVITFLKLVSTHSGIVIKSFDVFEKEQNI